MQSQVQSLKELLPFLGNTKGRDRKSNVLEPLSAAVSAGLFPVNGDRAESKV